MGVKRLIRVTTFLIAASVGAWNVGASADVLEDAEKLIAAGQHAAALELLEPLEDDRAGDPKFDYLLGIAYVDTGRPTLGVFALERVVDVQPNNAAARAELARAYFLLNEKDAAKLEFETAKKQKAPASVQATINKYLAAINQRSLAEKGGFSGYLEGSAGYDSNVNSATEDRLLGGLNPATRNFVLNKNSREQSSAFVGALGAGRYTHALRSDLDLFVGGFINAKENTSARFDTLTTSAEVGLQHLRGRDQFRASINGLLFWVTNPLVSHDINTRRYGISGEWRRVVTKNDVLTAFGQAAHLNYPGQSFRDADSFSGGLSWSHGYGGRGRPVVFASGFGGVDDVDKSGTPNSHFGRVFFGARIGGQYSYNRKTTLFGSVLYQHSNYGASDPVFNKRRTDDLLDLTAGVNYQVARDWVLVPQIRYTNNSSTIGVDDYDRAQLFVSARRSFN